MDHQTPETEVVLTPSVPELPPRGGAAPFADTSATPRWSVASAARVVGVAPSTLRTWHRRYGLGPSERTGGAHRRYVSEDISRLLVMRRLTREGMPSAEAARAALVAVFPAASPPASVVAAVVALTAGGIPSYHKTSGEGGGRVVGLPSLPPPARQLARMALALDTLSCLGLIREQLLAHGVIATWDRILTPLLVAVGSRWERTGSGVEVEHALSHCVITALQEITIRALDRGKPASSRPVLLAASAAESHTLPLFAVAAALAERNVRSVMLGARVPVTALGESMRRVGPAAVFLWSQIQSSADPKQLCGIPGIRPAPKVLLGGPGWEGMLLLRGAIRVHDLTSTVGELALHDDPI
jgi:MerR family transcriptional regulator, light-induced transcriptional regulator